MTAENEEETAVPPPPPVVEDLTPEQEQRGLSFQNNIRARRGYVYTYVGMLNYTFG